VQPTAYFLLLSPANIVFDTMSELLDLPLVPPSSAIIAPIIIMPTSYWTSQGLNENIAYGLERFQYQLLDRKTIYAHVIYLEPATPNVEFIPHHDMLLHHWKRYMTSLVERGRAKAFFIERIQLHQSVLDVVVPPLMEKVGELGELGLCKCSIDHNGLLLLSKYLSKNRTLKRLLLNENVIEDVDVARALSLAVKDHPTMEELCVSHCELGTNVDVLPEILGGCNRLKTLRLNENKISSQNVAHIGALLASPDTSLATLRLDKNLLSDVDAVHFTAALKSNTNLKYLYLTGNNITDVGKEKITTAVLDTTSLNSIADSNHNCEIVYSTLGTPGLASHINEKYWSTKRKVQSKILLALYGMNNETLSSIQYFRDLPLELIPHGLELIQKHLDCLEQHDTISVHMKNKPNILLGRMYCLLRVWNLPWLFVNAVRRNVQKRQKVFR